MAEPTTVWVVVSELGLSGAHVHAVLSEKPTVEQVAMYAHAANCPGAPGYMGTAGIPVQIGVPQPHEPDMSTWVVVSPLPGVRGR